MKKLLIRFSLLFSLGLCTGLLLGQSANVSGTIVDPLGNIWLNAKITATFQSAPYFNGMYTWSGGVLPTVAPSTTANVFGFFNLNLPKNTAIVPSGSTWQFSICPNASTSCAIFNYSVTADTDISALITANITSPNVVPQSVVPLIYNTNQINAANLNAGAIAYNVTTRTTKLWNGATWANLGGLGNATTSADGNTIYIGNIAAGNLPLSAFSYRSPITANNGIANAFSSCVAGSPCLVNAQANYPQDITHPNVSGGFLSSNSSGTNLNYFYNPFADTSNSGNEYTFQGNNCVQDFLNGPPTGSAGTTNNLFSNCLNSNFTESAATPNYGYFGFNTSGELISKTNFISANIHSSGIYSDSTIFTSADGSMDYNEYHYKTWYANGEAPSGENFEARASKDLESSLELGGSILTGGPAATSVSISCFADCQHAGTERWLLDYDQPLTNGYMTGWGGYGGDSGPHQVIGLSSLAVSETLPVSTCTGSVAAGWAYTLNGGPNTGWDVQFANNGAPPVTWVTFNTTSCTLNTGDLLGVAGRSQWLSVLNNSVVPTYSSSTTYQYGQGISYLGNKYISLTYNNINNNPTTTTSQWVLISAGAGQQTVAVQPTHSLLAGNIFFANGGAGYGVLFDANNGSGNVPYSSASGTHYPLPILGTTDAHHAILQLPLNGATYAIGNAIFYGVSVNTVSITGGVATITLNTDDPGLRNNSYLINATSVAITGNSNAALNVQYNNTTDTLSPFQGILHATPCTTLNASTCTTNSATLTGTGGNITVGGSGYGNTAHTIVPMAIVRDVNDPAITATQVGQGADKASGNYFKLDSNKGSWTPGHRVFESLLATNTGFDEFLSFVVNNPYRSSAFSQNYIGGQALTQLNGLGAPPSIYGWLSGIDANKLRGGGGTGFTAPYLMSAIQAPGVNGVLNSAIHYGFAPFPNYAPFLYFDCPSTPLGCSDPGYYTPVVMMRGRNGNGSSNWNANNNSLTDSSINAWYHTGYQYFTDILANNNGGPLVMHNNYTFPDALGTSGQKIVYSNNGQIGTFDAITGITPLTTTVTLTGCTLTYTSGILTAKSGGC